MILKLQQKNAKTNKIKKARDSILRKNQQNKKS